MEDRRYTAADITVLTWPEAVRQRPGMYLGIGQDDPRLPTRALQAAVEDALHLEDGEHRDVDVEIRSDLDFAITFEQGHLFPEPADLVLTRQRWWGLRPVAALSQRVLFEIQEAGQGSRQELRLDDPSPVVSFDASDQTKTVIVVHLDPGYFGPEAALTSALVESELHGEWCLGAMVSGRVTVSDLRRQSPV